MRHVVTVMVFSLGVAIGLSGRVFNTPPTGEPPADPPVVTDTAGPDTADSDTADSADPPPADPRVVTDTVAVSGREGPVDPGSDDGTPIVTDTAAAPGRAAPLPAESTTSIEGVTDTRARSESLPSGSVSVTISWRDLDDPLELWGLHALLVPGSDPDATAEITSSATELAIRPPFRAHVLPGSYDLVLERDEVELSRTPLVVGREPVTVELSIPALDRSGLAVVEVRTDTGHPVEGVRFFLISDAGSGSGASPRYDGVSQRSLAPGRVVIRALRRTGPNSRRRSATSILEASVFGLGSVQIPIEFGTDTVHEVVFPEPIPLEVRLLDYVGHAIQGTGYVTWGEGQEPKSWSTAQPDPLGRVHARVRPGLHMLAYGAFGAPSGGSRPVEFTAPELVLELPLDPLHDLTVEVGREFAHPGAMFTLHGAEGWTWTALVEPDRRLRFRLLPPGAYSLVAPAGWGMTLDLPRGDVPTFAPRPAMAVRIGALDEKRREAYGLREGTLVTALDGVPISDFSGMDAISWSFPSAASITVLRDGGEVEWRIDEIADPALDRSRLPLWKISPHFGGDR